MVCFIGGMKSVVSVNSSFQEVRSADWPSFCLTRFLCEDKYHYLMDTLKRTPRFLSRGSVCFQQRLCIEEQQQKLLPVTQFNCIKSNIFSSHFFSLKFPTSSTANKQFQHILYKSCSTGNPWIIWQNKSSCAEGTAKGCPVPQGQSSTNTSFWDSRNQHGYADPVLRKQLFTFLCIYIFFPFLATRNWARH